MPPTQAWPEKLRGGGYASRPAPQPTRRMDGGREGGLARDTLEYAMADPQGKWLGAGFLDVKESKLWWKADWNPPHSGPYFIEFSQRVRNNGSVEGVSFLDGIINVGVSIEPQIQP